MAIATLAWTIYDSRRQRHPDPPMPAVLAREVRIELRKQVGADTPEGDEITRIVVTELLRATDGRAGADGSRQVGPPGATSGEG